MSATARWVGLPGPTLCRMVQVEAPPSDTASSGSSGRVVAGLVAAGLVVAAGWVAVAIVHRAAARSATDAQVASHQSLVLASQADLNAAIGDLARIPLAERAPRVLPGAPTVGSFTEAGQPPVTVMTTLLQSTPEDVVAETVVTSDGLTTTVVEKYEHTPSGADSSWSCSFGAGGGSPQDCATIAPPGSLPAN